MPASSIALIFLRIHALSVFIRAISELVSILLRPIPPEWQMYVFPVVHSFLALFVWFFAPKISRILTRNNDGEFTLKGITAHQLFTTLIFGLGLYFVLDRFAQVFNWIHFFSINRSPGYGFHKENQPSFYELTEPALMLAAGLVLIFIARSWAERFFPQVKIEEAAHPDT